MSVFVTDAQQRKTLAVIRSLGRRGIEVGAGEETRLATAFFSRYCRQRVVYPSPARQPAEFVTGLLAHLRRHRCRVLIPMDDDALMLVARHSAEFSALARVPVARHEVLLQARDKLLTLQLAAAVGIAHPRTLAVSAAADLAAVVRELGFPLILRPRESSGSRGFIRVDSEPGLTAAYARLQPAYGGLIAQEFIPPGEKYDVGLLLNSRSELRAAFVQKELRGYPLDMGPSTLQESVHRPDLVATALRLLQAMDWSGIAEVEFMVDPRDGRPKLMEVNPRFWASLQLAVSAGVDFPYLLYRMALDGDVEPVLEYRAGVRCRWLLPGDLLHFLANPRRWHLEPGFFDFFARDTGYDIISPRDPGPVLGFFLAAARYLFDRRMWRFLLRR